MRRQIRAYQQRQLSNALWAAGGDRTETVKLAALKSLFHEQLRSEDSQASLARQQRGLAAAVAGARRELARVARGVRALSARGGRGGLAGGGRRAKT
jgi:hypothetical protein